MIRIFVVAIVLGLFSATYTYLGGMGTVIRTDMIQFVLLLVGGLFLTFMCIDAIGGWECFGKSLPISCIYTYQRIIPPFPGLPLLE